MTSLHLGGAGVSCMSYIGALCVLTTSSITTFSGNSAGGILAFLCCIGYSGKELMAFFLKNASIFSINMMSIVSGLLKLIFQVVSELCGYKHINLDTLTFQKLYLLTQKTLILGGTSLTHKRHVLFSHKTHPHMLVKTALAITSCVPLLFDPINLDGDLFVDGSLSDDYNEDALTPDTLCLMTEKDHTSFTSTTPFDVFMMTLQTIVTRPPPINKRIVFKNDRLLVSSLTKQDIYTMIHDGYVDTVLFFKKND
jgi:hypothetical protein